VALHHYLGEAAMDLLIENNTKTDRFETHVEGQVAFIAYSFFAEGIIFEHTEVPPSLEGRGIAGQLAKYALEYARENHLQVIARCPYVNAYIKRHPGYEELVRK